jgi:hypothetical protein
MQHEGADFFCSLQPEPQFSVPPKHCGISMANSTDTNAEADRSRLDDVLSAVPQPNRATRRKIEAKGDAVPVTLSSADHAAPAEAVQQDDAALPQSDVVQSGMDAGPEVDNRPAESAAEASLPVISAKRSAVSRKAPAAARPSAAEPASDGPAAQLAELNASASEATAPDSLSSEPALGADSAQPLAAVSKSNLPVFSIKDMTMDMSTNFAGFQTAMSEAQAKAKAAFEKSSSAMGEVSEFTKGNVEAVMASGKILAEGCQEIGSTMVAESRTAFEAMTGDIKELAAAKSPTDFLKIQSDMLRKSFDNAVAYSSKNSETFLKLMSDAAAPLSGRVSLAVEKVRQTTAAVPATV